MNLFADNKGPDQTVRMRSLCWKTLFFRTTQSKYIKKELLIRRPPSRSTAFLQEKQTMKNNQSNRHIYSNRCTEQKNRDELYKASVTERFVALRYATVRYKKSASWRFVTVFGADSLSEIERCIATRQNKLAAPDTDSARFKKLNVFCFIFLFLDQVDCA